MSQGISNCKSELAIRIGLYTIDPRGDRVRSGNFHPSLASNTACREMRDQAVILSRKFA